MSLIFLQPIRLNSLSSQSLCSPIQVPTPITTMKVSSKRVSVSAWEIFWTHRHTRRKSKPLSSFERIWATCVQLRCSPASFLIIHIKAVSLKDNVERKMEKTSKVQSLLSKWLKYLAASTCWDIRQRDRIPRSLSGWWIFNSWSWEYEANHNTSYSAQGWILYLFQHYLSHCIHINLFMAAFLEAADGLRVNYL